MLHGFLPLHIAAAMGKIEVVKMLLAQKGIIVPET
ncbi:MAG UNVERIFIED_CONTAM: ankyrin repeat domain-containing protein [Rickettsiaceae bacterium]|jgi:ankyrin repeat protein